MSDYGSRVRTRLTPPPGGLGAKNSWKWYIESTPNSRNWKQHQAVSQDITGYPYLTAEWCQDETHPGPPFTKGGPFQKIKLSHTMPFGAQAVGKYITNGAGYVVTPFGNGRQMYEGGFLPPGDFPFYWEQNNLPGVLKENSILMPDMGHLDQAAWDKTKPRIEQGGLFVALAELKDIPKMFETTAKGFIKSWEFSHNLFKPNLYGKAKQVKKSLIMSPKRAADHFLNHNFGWVPFVKDLADFLSNLRDLQQKIERVSKENGQWIRRRSILENVELDEPVPGWSGTGIHNVWPLNTSPANDTWVGTPTWEYRHKIQKVSTSVGTFRYYIPEFDVNSPEWGGLGLVRRALAIHGARINPYHIYQAVPWSWLVDWLTPVGHDLQVLQDSMSDDLVCRYLYTTTHYAESIEFKQFVPFNIDSGGYRTLNWSRTLETKRRKEASSPYGFGLSWDNLSPKQMAILAALGVTRV